MWNRKERKHSNNDNRQVINKRYKAIDAEGKLKLIRVGGTKYDLIGHKDTLKEMGFTKITPITRKEYFRH